MILRTKIKVIGEYKGKTKFPFWKDINKGDIITVSLKVTNPGRGNGLYASYLKIKNKTQNTEFTSSLTQSEKYFNNLEYEDIS